MFINDSDRTRINQLSGLNPVLILIFFNKLLTFGHHKLIYLIFLLFCEIEFCVLCKIFHDSR